MGGERVAFSDAVKGGSEFVCAATPQECSPQVCTVIYAPPPLPTGLKSYYSQTYPKDHTYIKTTGLYKAVHSSILSMLLNLHYKDHLCIRTTFCWSLVSYLYRYTRLIVLHQVADICESVFM